MNKLTKMLFPQRALDVEVAAMQASLLAGNAINPDFESGFFKDRKTYEPLLRSLLHGFEPEIDVLERLRYLSNTSPRATQFVREIVTDMMPSAAAQLAFFRDDANFSNHKFYMLTVWTEKLDVSRPRMPYGAASQQLVRLYPSGVVDPQYVKDMFFTGRTIGNRSLAPMLLAHDDVLRSVVDYRRDNTSLINLADKIREEYFHTLWLPKLISAEEYAEVKDLAPSITSMLYPTEWFGGYKAYRAALGFEQQTQPGAAVVTHA